MLNEQDELEVAVSPELELQVDHPGDAAAVTIDDVNINTRRPSINDIGEYATTDLGLGPAWGPFKYRKLPEPFLSEELARLSLAQTLGIANDVDVVTFQPSLNESDRSQDRYVVEDWAMNSATGHGDSQHDSSEFWSFRCVFDGHAGHETVDYASEHLIPLIKASLLQAFNNTADAAISPSPESISKLLSDAVIEFDNSIANAVLSLFPGEPESLDSISDDQIRDVINDDDRGGVNLVKVLRCMRGTTALIAVLDPKRDNLWVAGLGDCSAVLCTTEPNTGESNIAKAFLLTSHHNGKNIDEADRIKKEHPGETECLLRNRVLGSIAITRALGDHLFKLPAVYTKRIFMNSAIAFQFSSAPVTDILPRIISPPYLSNVPDVQHVNLKSYLANKHNASLVLCSDGLTDIFSNEGETRPIQDIVDIFPSVLNRSVASSSASNKTQNLALSLLREGLGGDDKDRVSSLLTLELESKWIDDITVVVQRL